MLGYINWSPIGSCIQGGNEPTFLREKFRSLTLHAGGELVSCDSIVFPLKKITTLFKIVVASPKRGDWVSFTCFLFSGKSLWKSG